MTKKISKFIANVIFYTIVHLYPLHTDNIQSKFTLIRNRTKLMLLKTLEIPLLEVIISALNLFDFYIDMYLMQFIKKSLFNIK